MRCELKPHLHGHTFWSALRAVRLHGDMRIEMVQRAICLLTPLPSTLVHALNLFIATARPLVLLRTGDRDEGVDLGKRMRILFCTRLSNGIEGKEE